MIPSRMARRHKTIILRIAITMLIIRMIPRRKWTEEAEAAGVAAVVAVAVVVAAGVVALSSS